MKQFTGCVVHGRYDLVAMQGSSLQTPVWRSEVVEFLSEYRVFVLHDRVVGYRCYTGDAHLHFRLSQVEKFVAVFRDESPAAYVVDFGVLATGETALVEVNEGYGFCAVRHGRGHGAGHDDREMA